MTNPSLRWNFDQESLEFSMDYDRVIRETIEKMNEFERRLELEVVISYLENAGYKVEKIDGDEDN